MIMKMNVMISRVSFLILNKYWECHEITEYLKMYSWRQVNMLNKWRVFNGDAEYVVAFKVFIRPDKFSFGQTVFLNCLTECQTTCLGFSICLHCYWNVGQYCYWNVGQHCYWNIGQYCFWNVGQHCYWNVGQHIKDRVACRCFIIT